MPVLVAVLTVVACNSHPASGCDKGLMFDAEAWSFAPRDTKRVLEESVGRLDTLVEGLLRGSFAATQVPSKTGKMFTNFVQTYQYADDTTYRTAHASS